MIRRLTFYLLLAFSAATEAYAQNAVAVFFDENDAVGADYRDASTGFAEGGDSLRLAGPMADKMPVIEGAFSGADGGLLAYRHGNGRWELFLAADGFAPQDLTAADSLVFYANGPLGVPGTALPRLGLQDAEDRETALLTLDLGGAVGFNAARSGFLPESATDAALSVTYVEALPAALARPGYPEDLRLTFAGEPLDTSRAAIGTPAVPAHFKIETASGTLQLEFSFRDGDGDGTLSAAGEYVDVLTPEAEGSDVLRPTWRVAVEGTPQTLPGAGDVFLLAVDNGGVDGDPATWQRVALAVTDFGPLGAFDITQVKAVRFAAGEAPSGARTLWIDYVAALEAGQGSEPPNPPTDATAEAGDSSVVLRWTAVAGAAGYHVYRQADPVLPFERLTVVPVAAPPFIDVDAENGRSYTYILRAVGSGGVPSDDAAPVTAAPGEGAPDVFLDVVARMAFDYFWMEANPSNGLVKDRSTDTSPSSIAAVGFGLSALTVGIDRGWITREQGAERVLRTLRLFWNGPQSTATDATGYRGFYYHFLDMQTGRRAWDSELSTIDTALLMGGVVHAGTYFDGAAEQEADIRALADSLYRRVEWDWAVVRPPAISHGWRPETGFLAFDWTGYNEAMILYLLALGSPTHPIDPSAWTNWTSTYRWETHYGQSFIVFPPLFGHQYSHVWVDFRGIQDAYMREKGIDYFENSRRATLANRAYAIANPGGWEGYGPAVWGLTASDVPDGYRARGAPPPQNDDGTIAPTAAGGSIAFTPELSAAALREMYRTYRAGLWGRYGFKDAFNPEANWFGSDYLGIDQGPILLMIENLKTERIWEVFMQAPAVQQGLTRAGFERTATAAEPDPVLPGVPTLLGSYPNPFRQRAEISFSLPGAARVTLDVYDLLGRRTATLVDGLRPPGQHVVVFEGGGWPSGVYFYRLQADRFVETGKMVMLQ